MHGTIRRRTPHYLLLPRRQRRRRGRALFSEKLAALTHKPVIVDHKGGAFGNIGTEAAAKSRPDGYAVLIATGSSTMATATSVFKKLPFDP
jgi:tripartite-type tricarboxylate transporter receptor subunit TctC